LTSEKQAWYNLWEISVIFEIKMQEETTQPQQPSQPSPEPQPEATAAGGGKVLVVEDEEILLAALREELETSGYTVEGAGNGVEGLEKVKSFGPQLILLDLVMPEMDGMEMLTKLKADEATKNIPVIVLTNLSDYERISEVLSLGAMDYLVKANYKLEDLLAKVKTVMERK
jgi:DNA-binding response OmpR family regulator